MVAGRWLVEDGHAAHIDEAALIARHSALAAELPRRADREGWLEARGDFYRRFYSIGNTPRVVSTIMQFRAEVHRYTTGLADIRLHIHGDLLERVRLGDPDLAAAWLESHLREVAGELRRRAAEREQLDETEGER